MFYDNSQQCGYGFSDDVQMRYDIDQEIIQIDEDRYGGAYSDHSYTAWRGVRPDGISDPDPTCEEFWKEWKDKAVYGGGETPQEAYLDLVKKIDALGLMVEDDHPARGPLLVVMLYQWGKPNVAFVYRSNEFREWVKARHKKQTRSW
jgi:hypothetical protein